MKRRIVIVEDCPEYAELIKRFHQEIDGHLFGDAELIVIQTLSMLQHLLATNGVSIIIMDLTLPDSPQTQTIEYVGQNKNQMPPVFAITGDERMEVRQQCLAVGFCGFAVKKHVVESPNFFFASLLNEYLRRMDHG